MPTETADILTLAQWLSPAFPVGAFSYSHGLETAIETGAAADADGLRSWVADVMSHGSGRSDAIFLAAAYQSDQPDVLAEIGASCRAYAASRERLLETELQGAAFAATTAAITGYQLAPMCYPVAVGRAARLHGLPLHLTAAMYLHAFASNLISVGMRLIPLGQTEGQAMISTLAPLCEAIAEETSHGDLDALSGTTFLADIAAMKHETQYTRIFRT